MTKLRTYAFIDASNIIYGAREEGWLIDQEKLYKYLKRKFNISKAFFYYGKDSSDLEQKKFFEKLSRIGYTLKVKEVKRFGKRTKANCDVDLTMDMLIKSDEYDNAIVMSGDGDFAPLFHYLESKGKAITIISSPKRTAKEIRSFTGSRLIYFNSLRYILEYKKEGDSKLDSSLSILV